MCVALIGVLYAIVLAIILLKSPDIIPEQRRGNVSSAVGYSFLVVPLLIFEVQFSLLNSCYSKHTFKLVYLYFIIIVVCMLVYKMYLQVKKNVHIDSAKVKHKTGLGSENTCHAQCTQALVVITQKVNDLLVIECVLAMWSVQTRFKYAS